MKILYQIVLRKSVLKNLFKKLGLTLQIFYVKVDGKYKT